MLNIFLHLQLPTRCQTLNFTARVLHLKSRMPVGHGWCESLSTIVRHVIVFVPVLNARSCYCYDSACCVVMTACYCYDSACCCYDCFCRPNLTHDFLSVLRLSWQVSLVLIDCSTRLWFTAVFIYLMSHVLRTFCFVDVVVTACCCYYCVLLLWLRVVVVMTAWCCSDCVLLLWLRVVVVMSACCCLSTTL